MDYPAVKKLVDKYWEGKTSLKEEQELHTYFNQENVDVRLKNIQPLFVFFKQEQEKKSERTLHFLQAVRQPPQRIWGLAAASIAILITIACWLYQQQHHLPLSSNLASQETNVLKKDTYEDPEEAFQRTKKALMRVSKGLNKGVKATKNSLEQTMN